MVRAITLLAASFIFSLSVIAADKPTERPAGVEQLLIGEWKGGPCAGELVFGADGAFERHHYSPVNCELAGAWELRLDAIPPTLVLSCKTSSDPDRVGKTVEVKLVQLDD